MTTKHGARCLYDSLSFAVELQIIFCYFYYLIFILCVRACVLLKDRSKTELFSFTRKMLISINDMRLYRQQL